MIFKDCGMFVGA